LHRLEELRKEILLLYSEYRIDEAFDKF